MKYKYIDTNSDLELVQVFLKEVIFKGLPLGSAAQKAAEIAINNLNENYEIDMSQQKIAMLADVSIRSVATAFIVLKENDILLKKGENRTKGYKLNPLYIPKLNPDNNEISVGICYVKKH